MRQELDQIEILCIKKIMEEGKEQKAFNITNTTEISKTITVVWK